MKRLFAASLLILSGLQVFSGEPLFSNGRTLWRIQLSPTAHKVEKIAAAQLQNDLKSISGCEFPVIIGDQMPEGNTIIIGSLTSTPLVAAAAQQLGLLEGGEQKLAVYTQANCLYLAGRTARGTLHAVNEFAYRQLGIRCFWPASEPDGTFIPKRKTLELPDLQFNYEPEISYRGYHFLQGTNVHLERFLARNQGNILRHGTAGGITGIQRRAEMGFYCYDTGHNVDPLHQTMKLDAATADRLHPEWFAEIAGKRNKSHFCWSNPEVVDYVGDRFAEYVDHFPNLDILGFYPTDNRNYCQCARCRKIGLSNAWFHLVSSVSGKLKQRHPDLRTATIAYEGYRARPDRLPVECDFVEYALYDRCFVHSLQSECPDNKRELAGDWGQWLTSGMRTGIYGYEFDIFQTSDTLLPIWEILGDEMRFFASHKTIAILPEVTGVGAKPPAPNRRITNRLALYLCSRLMWNPREEPAELIRDFCNYVFPNAKEEMNAYFQFTAERWRQLPRHLSVYLHRPESIGADFLNDDAIRQGHSLLDAARSKAIDARELREIERERQTFARWVEYSWLGRQQTLYLPEDMPVQEKSGVMITRSGNSLILQKASAGILHGTVHLPDGRIISAQGTGQAELQLPGFQGETCYLQIEHGKTKSDATLFCAGYVGNVKRLLYLHSGNTASTYGIPKVRRELFAKHWQVRVENLQKPLPKLSLSDFDLIVAILTPETVPEPNFMQDLKAFMQNGGVVLFSASCNIDFAGLLGDPMLTVQWSDNLEIPRINRSRRFPWMNSPEPFERELRSFAAPESGFLVPKNSRWQRVADIRGRDGEKLSPLLIAGYGAGALLLTTGTLGTDEYAYTHRVALSSSRTVTIISLLENLYRYYMRKKIMQKGENQ